MSRPSRRTTRFLRTWLSHRERLLVSEVTLSRDGDPVPGTFLIPPERVERVPAWIVLHGITRPGRAHVQLKRFTRSLASTGCAVIVPEVAEWRELVIAPYVTVPTIKAALEFLSERSDVFADRVGLVGFSFGAPQAIAAAAVPELRHRVAGVVGFGGYRDLERSLRFQFTGEHDWEGVAYAQAPDPYGRWIVGANYLHATQSYGDATELATALRTLASVAGDNGTPAWDAVYDPLKEKIRGEIPRDQRDLFDLFAPSHDRIPSGPAVESLVRELAAAARSEEPEIEPVSRLREVTCPAHVLHGRYDALMPFSEGLRLARELSRADPCRTAVTRLFGHSGPNRISWIREGWREARTFVEALNGVLQVV